MPRNVNPLCCRCKSRPKGSAKMSYCLQCEREYRASRQEKERAKHRRYCARHREELRQKREDRIEWWQSRAPEEIENLRSIYKVSGRQLPREFWVAMNRTACIHEQRELEALKRLPPWLSRAAQRFRKASLDGSRPSDSVCAKQWDELPHGK